MSGFAGLACVAVLIREILNDRQLFQSNQSQRVAQESSVQGTRSDISRCVSALMASNNPRAFLIISMHATDNVVQFTGDSGGVQMDFPMADESQKRMRSRIEEECASCGLARLVTRGSDGTEFWDYDIVGEPAIVAKTAQDVVIQIFSLEASSRLTFSRYGY